MIYKSCFVSLSFWVFRSFSLPVRVFNMSVLWGPLVCSHLQHMSQLENQTSLLPWRWQRDPGCHLDTWAPRSTEVWTPPGWTPSRWPRIRPISGWHRSSNRGTLQYAAVSWCKYNDRGENTTSPKFYRVQSFALWGGTCACRPLDQRRPSPWT